MFLGDFFPSVPPPRLRKDARRAALQYGKYTMSDLMLVLAYLEVATAAPSTRDVICSADDGSLVDLLSLHNPLASGSMGLC